ncbi:MAG: hypothetical protein NTU88_13150, partial [Armatimonadetes bacterium]|nr:hypothetical protein [Armatimonadota bacterium]
VPYWQIGNEPHNHSGYLGDGTSYIFSDIPDVYVRNYRAISRALKAEDGSLTVGPCFDSWDVRGSMRPERKYVPALFHSDAVIDCIWYQPYIDVHGVWPDESCMSSTLMETAGYILEEHHDRIVSHLVEAGRDPNTIEFGTSEFNFTCWYGSSSHLSQVRMLGVAEMLFAQIEHDYVTASTWDAVCEHGVEWPLFKFMRSMHDNMGDVLVDVYRQGPLRLYTMRDSASGKLSFWALNLGPKDRSLKVVLKHAPGWAAIIARRLGNRSGRTSLTDRNTLFEPECITWSETTTQSTVADADSILFTIPGYELMLVTVETSIPRQSPVHPMRRPARTAPDPQAHRKPPIRTSCAFLYPTIHPLPAEARLDAVRAAEDGVHVEWSAKDSDADWFVVQRDDGDGVFKTIGVADRGMSSLLDRHADGPATCTYRVISRNARGCGQPSNTLQVQVSHPAPVETSTMSRASTLVHFPFKKDARSVERLADVSGGSFHGIIHGASWQLIDGIPCLDFDGTSSFVEVPDLPHLAYGPGQEASIVCTFRTQSGGTLLSRNPQYHRPVPRSADTEYWLGIITADDIAKRKREMFHPDKLQASEGRVRWSGGTLYRSLRELAGETAHRVDDGRWHQLIVVLRGDRGQLFLDGALEDVWVSDWNTPHACTALIGARRNMYLNALDKHFKGVIAELRIERRALSRSEILSMRGPRRGS